MHLIWYIMTYGGHATTHTEHWYFFSIVDNHTWYTWIHLLKHKSKATLLLKNFITWVHTQFVVTIWAVRIDNVEELMLTQFLVEKGIQHQFSCVETPKQNTIVERKH